MIDHIHTLLFGNIGYPSTEIWYFDGKARVYYHGTIRRISDDDLVEISNDNFVYIPYAKGLTGYIIIGTQDENDVRWHVEAMNYVDGEGGQAPF